MDKLLQTTTVELTQFLNATLPRLSPNWCQDQVVDRLSFQQQLKFQERGLDSIEQLELASLPRVMDCLTHRAHILEADG